MGVQRQFGQTVILGQANPVGVDVGQLVEVEAGRRLADAGQVEPFDGLLVAEQFVVAVGPAQTRQIVAHGLGQIAHLGVFMHRLGAVTLGQLGAVGAMDQRDVGEGRPGPAQGVIDQALAGGVVQVIVATNDVGHAHVVIVHHHSQVVGRGAVRADDDQVVQRRGFPAHAALHRVIDRHRLIQRATKTDGGGLGQVIDGRLAVAPGRDEVAALGLGLITQGVGFVGAQEVAIGMPGGQQLFGDLAMAVGAGELEDRLLVAEQLQPGQAVEDGFYGVVGRTLAVRVLDADQELPAPALGVEPVE
ncbi:hypothetical protein D3C80_949260 [compost metagenome]